MLSFRRTSRGFTLVEAMVTIAILGALLAAGLPSFIAWIQNSQIRSSAESMLNGLQLARAHAVKANANVEFLLTTDPNPSEENVGAVTPWPTGTNWLIRNERPLDGVAFGPADFIQGRAGQDGSRQAIVNISSDGGAIFSGSLVFTPLGRLRNSPPNNIEIDVSSANSYDGERPMRIRISPGGQIRMCDPDPASKLANPTNPQFC